MSFIIWFVVFGATFLGGLFLGAAGGKVVMTDYFYVCMACRRREGVPPGELNEERKRAVDVAHITIAECHMESRVLPYRAVLEKLFDDAMCLGFELGRDAAVKYIGSAYVCEHEGPDGVLQDDTEATLDGLEQDIRALDPDDCIAALWEAEEDSPTTPDARGER